MLDNLFVGSLKAALNNDRLREEGVKAIVSIHNFKNIKFGNEIDALIIDLSDSVDADAIRLSYPANGQITYYAECERRREPDVTIIVSKLHLKDYNL